jgi:monofunctional biosynthetic peptidoglycan transglycosylase
MNPDDPDQPKPEDERAEAAPLESPPQADPPQRDVVYVGAEAAPETEPEPPAPDVVYVGSEPDPEPEAAPPARSAEPLYVPQQAAVPPPRSNERAYMAAQPEDAEMPMPRQAPTRADRQRARDARVNLDLDLGRIKRRKRYGLLLTTITVLFIAFVLAPVTWVAIYRFADAPSTILMMQRAAEGETIRHYPVPINRISEHMVRAVIAAEDSRFCEHEGFDVEAIQDALESNARGGGLRGASTISQQTAKNLFLWIEPPNARGGPISWVRKGIETYFTALIEFMWPKRRIMEHYLNVAEFGDGNFGIEAAARARFGVSAADLTPLQAARLAAVLPSPNRYSAENPGPYVRRQSASIAQRARVVRNERLAACALYLDRPDQGRQ